MKISVDRHTDGLARRNADVAFWDDDTTPNLDFDGAVAVVSFHERRSGDFGFYVLYGDGGCFFAGAVFDPSRSPGRQDAVLSRIGMRRWLAIGEFVELAYEVAFKSSRKKAKARRSRR